MLDMDMRKKNDKRCGRRVPEGALTQWQPLKLLLGKLFRLLIGVLMHLYICAFAISKSIPTCVNEDLG